MDRSFRGAAKRLDDIDLPKLGHRLGVGCLVSAFFGDR